MKTSLISTVNDLRIEEVTPTNIEHIATLLSRWQQNPDFNRFLLEKPTDAETNAAFIGQRLQGKHSIARIAIVANQVAGLFFLHNFNENDRSIEASMRVAPEFQGLGIATQIKNAVSNIALEIPDIDKVSSWHSALNKGSFHMNRKCGGSIVNFVPSQTFLPNINTVTDDFKWEVTAKRNTGEHILEIINPVQHNAIIEGLKKHNFI